MSEKIKDLLEKLDALKSDVAALLPADETVGLSAKERRDHLVSMYGEIAKYDCHYSTVRTGLTTFLTGIGLLYGVYAVLRESEPFGIVLVFVLYAFALAFNLRFYRMTRACWEMQKRIEEELRDSLGVKALAEGATLFRTSLGSLFGPPPPPSESSEPPKPGWLGRRWRGFVSIFPRRGTTTGSGVTFPDKRIGRRPDGLFWTTLFGHLVVLGTLILYCLVFDARCKCRSASLFSPPEYGECRQAHGAGMLPPAGLPADDPLPAGMDPGSRLALGPG